MTLIVTVATPCFVMQAGDRLLTREIAEEDYEIYDANSNKNVIYEASDGLLTISYAGIAFINRQPTDEWLAHLLQYQLQHLHVVVLFIANYVYRLVELVLIIF